MRMRMMKMRMGRLQETETACRRVSVVVCRMLAVCCELFSVVFSLLSAVCCLLSVVCCLLFVESIFACWQLAYITC